MRLNKLGNQSKVAAEQNRLEKERQSVERQRLALEKQLRSIPKSQPKKARDLARTKLNVDTIVHSPAAIAFGNQSSKEKRKMLPARELHSARIKFLILTLILATLVIMLWNAMPS